MESKFIINNIWTKEEIEILTKQLECTDDFTNFENIFKIFPEECYDLDRFPLYINNNKKYNQVETYYDLTMRKSQHIEVYMGEVRKIKELFKKTWLYNNTIVYTNLSECNIRQLRKVLESEKFERLKQLRKRLRYSNGDFKTINQIKDLEVLLELSLSGRIWVVYIFLEFKLIIWSNDLIMPLYLGNSKYKKMFQTMCTTEGLYLRKDKEIDLK